MDGGRAVQVGQHGRMDVQAAVPSGPENTRGHQETKGHGDNQVVRHGGSPAGKGVDLMGWEGKLVGGGLDGHCWHKQTDSSTTSKRTLADVL